MPQFLGRQEGRVGVGVCFGKSRAFTLHSLLCAYMETEALSDTQLLLLCPSLYYSKCILFFFTLHSVKPEGLLRC